MQLYPCIRTSRRPDQGRAARLPSEIGRACYVSLTQETLETTRDRKFQRPENQARANLDKPRGASALAFPNPRRRRRRWARVIVDTGTSDLEGSRRVRKQGNKNKRTSGSLLVSRSSVKSSCRDEANLAKQGQPSDIAEGLSRYQDLARRITSHATESLAGRVGWVGSFEMSTGVQGNRERGAMRLRD